MDEEFQLPDGSYSISDIQYYFEYIFKKPAENIENPSVKIYVNNKEYNQKLYYFSDFTKNDVNLVKLIFDFTFQKSLSKYLLFTVKKRLERS